MPTLSGRSLRLATRRGRMQGRVASVSSTLLSRAFQLSVGRPARCCVPGEWPSNRRVSKWIAIGGVLLWAAGVTSLAIALSWDVVTERVTFTTADGTAIAGTLYRPRTAPAQHLPAAIVVHGAAVSHTSCGLGLSLPLAKHNVLTLAIDLPGHGGSGGSLPRSWFANPSATLKARADHPEIDAAIDFLKSRPDYLGWDAVKELHCLTLVGHSLGGWAVTNVGYRREDVQGVVSIGAAPEVCDVSRPRNFLIVTGGTDQLCPREKGLEILARARGDAVLEPEAAYGRFIDGSDRRLIHIGRVNHITQLADTRVTRATVQWVLSSMEYQYGSESTGWSWLVVGAVLIASLGGLCAATAILGSLGHRTQPLQANTGRAGAVRITLLALLLVGLIPAAAALGDEFETGPVYFAVSAVVLVTLIGGVSCAIGPAQVSSAGRLSFRDCGSGVVLGLAALVLAFGWFGVPWGLTWVELVPTQRRLLLALALWPLLLPGCLGLAVGLRRLTGAGGAKVWPRWAVGLIWLAVPAALATGYVVLTAGWQPLFIVPVALLSVSFLPSLPLWLLADRPGLSLARSLCHAGATAWLLGCHLPFVHGVVPLNS